MKRTLAALILALPLLFAAEAQADLLGAYVQGHLGYQETNRTGHSAMGAAAGVMLLGFEGYADLRFLRDGFKEDRGMFNQIGLRFGIDLPLPGIDLRPYAGVAYVYSKVADEDVDPNDPDDPTRYKGVNPHVGLRLAVPFAAVMSLGVQAEAGYTYLFPNDLPYSSKPNFGILGALRVGI